MQNLNSVIRCKYGKGANAHVLTKWNVFGLADNVMHADESIAPADFIDLSISAAYPSDALTLAYRQASDTDRANGRAIYLKASDGTVALKANKDGQPIALTYDESRYFNTFIIPALVAAESHDVIGTEVDYRAAKVNGHHITFEYVAGLTVSGGRQAKPKKARTTKRRGGKNHK